MRPIPNGWFITGTDTNVGKTHISVGLLTALRQRGQHTVALKPIASGCEVTALGLRNSDACLLQQAATVSLSYPQVNPIAFQEPIAPHIAAQHNNYLLSVAQTVAACQPALNTVADYIVIEGAGGWLTPLNADEHMGQLAQQLGYPIVLVVGMRLGCINHALLTLASIRAAQLPLAGWVANSIDPHMAYPADSIATLQHHIPAPLWGIIPYQEKIDPQITAHHLARIAL